MPSAGSIVGIIFVVLFVACLAILLFQGPTQLRTPRARRVALAKARAELEAFGDTSWRDRIPSGPPTRRPLPRGYQPPPPYADPPALALRAVSFAEVAPLGRSENSTKSTVGPAPSTLVPVLRSPPPRPPTPIPMAPSKEPVSPPESSEELTETKHDEKSDIGSNARSDTKEMKDGQCEEKVASSDEESSDESEKSDSENQKENNQSLVPEASAEK